VVWQKPTWLYLNGAKKFDWGAAPAPPPLNTPMITKMVYDGIRVEKIECVIRKTEGCQHARGNGKIKSLIARKFADTSDELQQRRLANMFDQFADGSLMAVHSAI